MVKGFKEFEDQTFYRTATPIDITLEILKEKLNQKLIWCDIVTARRDFDNRKYF